MCESFDFRLEVEVGEVVVGRTSFSSSDMNGRSSNGRPLDSGSSTAPSSPGDVIDGAPAGESPETKPASSWLRLMRGSGPDDIRRLRGRKWMTAVAYVVTSSADDAHYL